MDAKKHTQYVESKVLTAPPHRLHLMLLEGAIRFGRQALSANQQGESLASSPALMRVIDILVELLAGVRERKAELNRKIADVYVFLFRTAAAAKVNDDPAKLAETLKLLEFERETWQLVCDKLGSDATPPAKAAAAAPRPVIAPLLSGDTFGTRSGISFEV